MNLLNNFNSRYDLTLDDLEILGKSEEDLIYDYSKVNNEYRNNLISIWKDEVFPNLPDDEKKEILESSDDDLDIYCKDYLNDVIYDLVWNDLIDLDIFNEAVEYFENNNIDEIEEYLQDIEDAKDPYSYYGLNKYDF